MISKPDQPTGAWPPQDKGNRSWDWTGVVASLGAREEGITKRMHADDLHHLWLRSNGFIVRQMVSRELALNSASPPNGGGQIPFTMRKLWEGT